MKGWLGLFLGLILLSVISCKEPAPQQYYDSSADGVAQIDSAVLQAQAEDKYVLVQVGGDWCGWCHTMNTTLHETTSLREVMDKHYVWVHLYYGPENDNAAALARLRAPKGLGYPFFVVLNGRGQVLRVQETGRFEEGEGYSAGDLLSFLLTDWSSVAPLPAQSEGMGGVVVDSVSDTEQESEPLFDSVEVGRGSMQGNE